MNAPVVESRRPATGAGLGGAKLQEVPLDADRIKGLCTEAGADDVGIIRANHPDLAVDAREMQACLPWAKSLIAIVRRLNREPIRSPARSVANLEFHTSADDVNGIAREIVRRLERCGIRAVNTSMGFPMEMDNFPDKIWIISHKLVAVAAGLGRMGIHRNVIHPRFGNFILLATLATDREVGAYTSPIDFNPCLECKLCVSACPVGAIGAGGEFNFSACYNHNYREFMGGFTNWVETVADAPNRLAYREQVADGESASMWQSLSFGASYKAAYCMAVCPAGEDVIAPFLSDRPAFVRRVVRPLQRKADNVYVVGGSDAAAHVRKRFPHKQIRAVPNGLRPTSIGNFIGGMSLTFQPGQAEGLDATFHFRFTGRQAREVTICIRERRLEIRDGLAGKPDLRVTVDADFWIAFLRGERNIATGILSGRLRLKGRYRLLLDFGRCFPA